MTMIAYQPKELKEKLTEENIISILEQLGAERYEDKSDSIIFPTVCHNADPSNASMKLYYYKESKLFHCYTGCAATFDIYDLVKRWYLARGRKEEDISFRTDIYDKIANQVSFVGAEIPYEKKSERYERRKLVNNQFPYPEEVLNIFDKIYPPEWIVEGITKASMDTYNILFSMSRNQIIIPHYNYDGHLVGIRGRLLNKEEAETYGKYMPLRIEDTLYRHRLMFNLYGLHLSKVNIKRKGIAILFEGEKSVLKYESFFGDNISAAVCGSSISKAQIDLLSKAGAKEVVIAFDKEFSNNKERATYYNKLCSIAERFTRHMDFSIIMDRENLLTEKDSPIDQGVDIFNQLLKTRTKVRS